MRLGTLARKTNITPSSLTSYLSEQGVDLTSGNNTKLSEDQVEAILTAFDKSLAESEPIEKETVVEEEVEVVVETTEIDPVETPVEPVEIVEEEIDVVEAKEEIDVVEAKEEIEVELIAQPEIEVIEKVEIIAATESEAPIATTTEEESPKYSDSFSEIALPHELENDMVDEEPIAVEMSLQEIVPEVASENIETTDEEIALPEEVLTEEVVEEEEVSESIVINHALLDSDIESEVEMAAHDASIKVIKPKKVELQGLTIKGKIELPEPVKKVVEEKPEEPKKPKYDPNKILTTQGPESDRRRKPKNYKGKKFDKGYNPVEAVRKKKEWEEKKRKENELKQKKTIKEKYYKTKAIVPAVAPIKKKVKKYVAKKAQPKFEGNALQRFWQWMNT